MKSFSQDKTRKRLVSQWEELRLEVHELLTEQCESTELMGVVDTDEVIEIFLSFALALEVISQTYIESASNLAEKDLHHKVVDLIKEDKNFIAAYKKSMGKSISNEFTIPENRKYFVMPRADA